MTVIMSTNEVIRMELNTHIFIGGVQKWKRLDAKSLTKGL